jgi:hypothetical protein
MTGTTAQLRIAAYVRVAECGAAWRTIFVRGVRASVDGRAGRTGARGARPFFARGAWYRAREGRPVSVIEIPPGESACNEGLGRLERVAAADFVKRTEREW